MTRRNIVFYYEATPPILEKRSFTFVEGTKKMEQDARIEKAFDAWLADRVEAEWWDDGEPEKAGE